MLRRVLLAAGRTARAPACQQPRCAPQQLRSASVAAWRGALGSAPRALLPRAAACALHSSAAARAAQGTQTLAQLLKTELAHELEHYDTPEARA